MAREPGETLYDFVQRRERELENMADALRSELVTVETELAHVRSARRQMANLPTFGRTPLQEKPANPNVPALAGRMSSYTLSPELRAGLASATENIAGAGAQIGSAMSAALASIQKGLAAGATEATIKQLVMKAMLSSAKFVTGATAPEIREYISHAYGRDISPQSLSPQLSRLKAEGSLKQEDDDLWCVTATGAMRYGARDVMAEYAASLAILKFKVAKSFNSQNQRFLAGTELEFSDIAARRAFAESLRPLDFFHLIKEGFLEPVTEGQS